VGKRSEKRLEPHAEAGIRSGVKGLFSRQRHKTRGETDGGGFGKATQQPAGEHGGKQIARAGIILGYGGIGQENGRPAAHSAHVAPLSVRKSAAGYHGAAQRGKALQQKGCMAGGVRSAGPGSSSRRSAASVAFGTITSACPHSCATAARISGVMEA